MEGDHRHEEEAIAAESRPDNKSYCNQNSVTSTYEGNNLEAETRVLKSHEFKSSAGGIKLGVGARVGVMMGHKSESSYSHDELIKGESHHVEEVAALSPPDGDRSGNFDISKNEGNKLEDLVTNTIMNHLKGGNIKTESLSISTESSVRVVEEDEVIELEFVKADYKDHEHTSYCPNCNSQISKVIFRRKKESYVRSRHWIFAALFQFWVWFRAFIFLGYGLMITSFRSIIAWKDEAREAGIGAENTEGHKGVGDVAKPNVDVKSQGEGAPTEDHGKTVGEKDKECVGEANPKKHGKSQDDKGVGTENIDKKIRERENNFNDESKPKPDGGKPQDDGAGTRYGWIVGRIGSWGVYQFTYVWNTLSIINVAGYVKGCFESRPWKTITNFFQHWARTCGEYVLSVLSFKSRPWKTITDFFQHWARTCRGLGWKVFYLGILSCGIYNLYQFTHHWKIFSIFQYRNKIIYFEGLGWRVFGFNVGSWKLFKSFFQYRKKIGGDNVAGNVDPPPPEQPHSLPGGVDPPPTKLPHFPQGGVDTPIPELPHFPLGGVHPPLPEVPHFPADGVDPPIPKLPQFPPPATDGGNHAILVFGVVFLLPFLLLGLIFLAKKLQKKRVVLRKMLVKFFSDRTDQLSEILKCVVYGGLIESITSLSVVVSIAASDATTLNVLVIGLGVVFSGLIAFGFNLADLKNDVGSKKHQQLFGGKKRFLFHSMIAMLSYLAFGLAAPVTYSFTFHESDTKSYKMIAVVAIAFACIVTLAIAKAYVEAMDYIKTTRWYLFMAVVISGVAYVVGSFFEIMMLKLGSFKSAKEICFEQVKVPTWQTSY